MTTSLFSTVPPNLSFSRDNTEKIPVPTQKKHWKVRRVTACCVDSSRPFSKLGMWRRDLLFTGFSSSLSLVFPTLGSCSEEELKMDVMVDELNAYSYSYPAELPSSKFVFKWVESRKPERYSSAAPLSRFPIRFFLCSLVQIGPPNSLFLRSKDKSTWSPKDVAESVLADKSALRVTSTQRMDESSVLDAHSSIIDGESYWYYEYLVRKSPTQSSQEPNLYRHFVASTAARDGYLYSLNASTLSRQWDKMGPFLEKTVASFRLLPPTENYVPPFKDPWRFW
ncbi:psbP domain-containing protein 5, chloroplastic isoform X2 [Primulina eburnea]|uniref:psbP domain-containing protein 5, chloroplastic isoform X2 n=1 Tax=Primulina eburnea TaxID=1245227 RepID=UPI003C6C84CA